MLLPFQGDTAPTHGTQGVATLALGSVLHWAFSPSLLNPKLQLLIEFKKNTNILLRHPLNGRRRSILVSM